MGTYPGRPPVRVLLPQKYIEPRSESCLIGGQLTEGEEGLLGNDLLGDGHVAKHFLVEVRPESQDEGESS